MLKITISNPPANMHPEQSFENEKHMTTWIKEQTDSGKLLSGKVNKSKLELVIPDGTESGRSETCLITQG